MRTYSPEYLYMTTIGRKSGRPHEIEIWYVPHGGNYYLVSEGREKADWVQNILKNPTVSVYVEGRRFDGVGRPVDPEGEPELAAAIQSLFDAKYNWSTGLIMELKPNS